MTYIIAEIGVNHDGSFERAKKLIDLAKKAGADAAKFQMFISENEIHPETRQADYQAENIGKQQTMLEMVKPLELKFEEFKRLKAYCDKVGIDFMSSVFDIDSLDYYVDVLGCRTVKFGSGELRNPPLLVAAARKKVDVIISTGMSEMKDIEFGLGLLAFGYTAPKAAKPGQQSFREAFKSKKGQAALKKHVTILQCTTDYPAKDEMINLRAMQTIAKKFGLPVGFSDHSVGIGLACASVALGATVYEKHFTDDNDLPGPDHKASLNPENFALCVREMRSVEKGLGTGVKKIEKPSAEIAKIACRNLVAWAPIKKGEKLTEQNIWSLRTNKPGKDSRYFYDLVGKSATKDYEKGELIA